ncbi:MAG: hypothetical protein HC866_02135 [Leptolyngbyaceae cyanobacterium RU_5_1]|nr:hypothetical protein [Leptolyngbyaceae cyanobacterium RU_5_1]
MSVFSNLDRAIAPKTRFSTHWIVSQRYDLFFFIGSCVFTLAFWGVYRIAHHFNFILQGDSILITYFFFTALFDHPHIFQTFSRTHFDPLEFKQRRNLHTWGLFVLIVIGLIIIGFGREAELIVFASIFGTYHIIRQHYGFLKAYKNINQDRSKIDDWLDFGTFNSGMFACFFYDYTDIGGPVVIYKDLQSYFPDLPPAIAEIAWSIFIVFLILFISRQFIRLICGEAINLPKILLMLAVLSTHYFIFFVTATPFLVAEALETAFHNVQYQGWMMHYQNRRFPAIKHVVLKWFAIALLYGMGVGVIEIFGLMYQNWCMWVFIPFTMIVIYHYLVDGLIWKFSQQPELRQLLFGRKRNERAIASVD